MLDLNPDECRLVAHALNVLAQRDGLSQPHQYAMSSQIVVKVQDELRRRSAAPVTDPEPEKLADVLASVDETEMQ